jgi:hypothetical protein
MNSTNLLDPPLLCFEFGPLRPDRLGEVGVVSRAYRDPGTGFWLR